MNQKRQEMKNILETLKGVAMSRPSASTSLIALYTSFFSVCAAQAQQVPASGEDVIPIDDRPADQVYVYGFLARSAADVAGDRSNSNSKSSNADTKPFTIRSASGKRALSVRPFPGALADEADATSGAVLIYVSVVLSLADAPA